jgi:hypothetical protein
MTESKAEYRALPCCKLCGSNTDSMIYANVVVYSCSNIDCAIYDCEMDYSEWRKLMGHPALTHEQVQNIERGLLSRGMNVNGHEIRAIYDAVLREI